MTKQPQKIYTTHTQEKYLHVVPIRFIWTFDTVSSNTIWMVWLKNNNVWIRKNGLNYTDWMYESTDSLSSVDMYTTWIINDYSIVTHKKVTLRPYMQKCGILDPNSLYNHPPPPTPIELYHLQSLEKNRITRICYTDTKNKTRLNEA